MRIRIDVKKGIATLRVSEGFWGKFFPKKYIITNDDIPGIDQNGDGYIIATFGYTNNNLISTLPVYVVQANGLLMVNGIDVKKLLEELS